MTNTKCPACGIGNSADAANCLMCGCELAAQTPPAPQTVAHTAQTEVRNGGFQPSAPPVQQNPFTPPVQNYQSHPPHYQNHPPRTFYGGNHGQTQYRANYRQNFAPPNQKTGLAIASLIFGGVSFLTALFLVGLVLAPIGLILGIVALVKAKKQPRVYGGKGIAIAGVVMSSVVFLILPMILAIAIPNLLAARRAANESGTIAGIKKIAAAEETILTNTNICADLPELVSKNLIDQSFAGGTKFGYRYVISNLPSKGCEIYAVPIQATGISATGARSFYYSTEDKVIRAAEKQGKMAEKSDPPLGESNSSAGSKNSGGWFEEPPNVERAKRNLRTLQSAAITYQATHGAGKCGTIADLEDVKLIGPALGDGVDAGYRYNLTVSCELSATPLSSSGKTLSIDKFGSIQ